MRFCRLASAAQARILSDVRKEAHVEHVIGFVEDERLHVTETRATKPCPHQIEDVYPGQADDDLRILGAERLRICPLDRVRRRKTADDFGRLRKA